MKILKIYTDRLRSRSTYTPAAATLNMRASLISHISCFDKFSNLIILLILSACSKVDTIPAVFKNPTVEIISAYSIDDKTGEVNLDISEVFQTIPQMGVVWSDKPNPTTSDNRLTQDNIKADQDFTFVLSNLQKGKTYYIRGYYTLNNETAYSSEMQFVQNYNGMWVKLPSPELNADEYISADDIFNTGGYGGNIIINCYKVNRLTQNSVLQSYFKSFGQWNPSYYGNRNAPTPPPRQMVYNPIYAEFQGGADAYSLYGAGYQELPKNRGRLYDKAMQILESNGRWESYPGADARVSSFGIGSYPYVMENLPNGKLWRFDFSVLKWNDWGKVPTTKAARLIAFDAGERAFVLVEPENTVDAVKELYEYLPNEKRWERKADFMGEDRRNSTGFVTNNRIFFGLGQATKDLRGLRDIWEYSVTKNTWQKVADYPGGGTVNNFAFGNTGTGFVGFGQQYRRTSIGGDDYRQTNDFWQFRPQ